MLDQFDKLKRRNAFLEQYKKEKMFENGLEEFDDARWGMNSLNLMVECWFLFCRATCEELLNEYKSCESPDYISYVNFHLTDAFAFWLNRSLLQGAAEGGQ